MKTRPARWSPAWQAAALLLAVFGVSAQQPHMVSAQRQQEITAACTRTNQDYQYHRDRGNAQAYGALFTKDAEFVLQSPLKGRAAITAAMQERFAERKTRHFVNLVRLDVTGPDSAEGLLYLMLTGGAKGASAGTGTVDLVAEYRDRYRMAAGRCLIQRREVEVVFLAGER